MTHRRGPGRLALLLLAALAVWPAATARGKRVAVVGAGYAGLAAACELRQLGHDVIVLERNAQVGGRAYTFEADSFTFDAGPSWYWMPEVFERFFERYGRRVDDFYTLKRLDPAYRVVKGQNSDAPHGFLDVPGTFEGFRAWAAELDPAAAPALGAMFEEAQTKYEKGVFEWIWKPMTQLSELVDLDLARAALENDMFGSLERHLAKFTSSSALLDVLKWPVIFLGASPANAPSLYSLMTYAGHALGTWYPSGGMAAPARAMADLATQLGAEIRLNAEVTALKTDGASVTELCLSNGACERVDGVVNAGDYHHFEQHLLPFELRRYDERFWDRQVMSPSCLLFYLGFDRSLPGLLHHTFFFDANLDAHLHATFDTHEYSDEPTFYVSATSKTDPSVAPKTGGEALFVLVPISYQLNGTDSQARRAQVLDLVFRRLEAATNVELTPHLVFQKSYGPEDFEKEFYAFRGNAFGHANILSQSLVLKPSMDSLAANVAFAGHLTHPGPGVPPAIVSGTVAAQLLHDKISASTSSTTQLPFGTVGTLLMAVLLLHLATFTLVLARARTRSYALCVKLLYEHGRTYFAAATLMNTQRFLDTAAMYGLFRIADDFVDNADDPAQREANLEAFIADFWRCLELGRGDPKLHPALPAIIESSLRHQYPDDLFNRFFRSMRMDTGTKVCQTMDDTMDYMEGSAAVIGEFMMPILMPEADPERYSRAMPHARDLGVAFQLTNMIRDINEDLDLDRQYIPVESCRAHGVDLATRNPAQAGFRALIEELLSFTDTYYASADIGIALLPDDVRDVIRVARIAYHRIHHKIRERNCDIFAGRVRVPFREKLEVLLNVVPPLKLARVFLAELYFRALYLVCQMPGMLLTFATLLSGLLTVPGCTYARFHLIYIVPALVFAAFAAWMSAYDRTPQQQQHLRFVVRWIAVLCVVATVYTTPWDNYLVYKGVWGYPPDRILYRIGWVPIEEYAFFTLETLFVGAIWLNTFPIAFELHLSTHRIPQDFKPTKCAVGTFMIILWFAGLWMLSRGADTLYMGLILTWSLPVLLIQWLFGAHVLWMHKWRVFKCSALAAFYLCIADQWAIRHGIWWLSTGATLPHLLPGGLPLEEATFFVVTAVMCTWGLTLAMVVSKLALAQNTSLFTAAKTVWRMCGEQPPAARRGDPSSHHGSSKRLFAAASKYGLAKSAVRSDIDSTPFAHSLALVCVSTILACSLPYAIIEGKQLTPHGASVLRLVVVALQSFCGAILLRRVGYSLMANGLANFSLSGLLLLDARLGTALSLGALDALIVSKMRLRPLPVKLTLAFSVIVPVALDPRLLLDVLGRYGASDSDLYRTMRLVSVAFWALCVALARQTCRKGVLQSVFEIAIRTSVFSTFSPPMAAGLMVALDMARSRLHASEEISAVGLCGIQAAQPRKPNRLEV